MVLIKDATEKAINTAILALNDDIEKVKASNSSSSSSGIKEGETYNINISGNANTASKVKNALTLNVGGNATSYDGSSAKTVTIGSNAKLTITSTTGYTTPSTTVYDGSEAKTINIEKPIKKVFLGNLGIGNYSIDISKYDLIESILYTNVNSAVSTVSAAIDATYLQNTFYFTDNGTTYKGATCLVISLKKIVQVYKYDFSGYSFDRLAVYGI